MQPVRWERIVSCKRNNFMSHLIPITAGPGKATYLKLILQFTYILTDSMDLFTYKVTSTNIHQDLAIGLNYYFLKVNAVGEIKRMANG